MIVHQAGPLVDQLQRCVRCDILLVDYRNANLLDTDLPPSGFAEGAAIEMWTGPPRVMLVSSREPTCAESPD